MRVRWMLFGLFGLLLCLALIVSAGCAGGLPGVGEDPADDSPGDNTPVDDPPADDPPDGGSSGGTSCVDIPGGTTYLSYVLLDGTDVLRFTKSTITVSMDTTNTPTGWKPEYAQYVRDSMAAWQTASRGAYSFQEVSSGADITISWVDSLGDDTTGITEHVIVGQEFFAPLMKMAMDASGGRLPDSEIEATTIHEFGHALGMMGHSPNVNDVMWASSTALSLTANDQQTLLDLYCRPADITQSLARTRAVPEGARIIRQERHLGGCCEAHVVDVH